MFNEELNEELIKAYAVSQGATSNLAPWEAIKESLIIEYGRIAPCLSQVKEVKLERILLSSIKHFPRYVDSIEARAPIAKGESIVGENPILGLVVPLEEGYYRLVDGHHRLKWALEKSLEEGLFIVAF